MKILAGDIGGTKTLLQLLDVSERRQVMVQEHRYDSHQYEDLLPMVQDFLAQAALSSLPDTACFGVAGPVTETPQGQQANITNLPWQLDSERLSTALGIPRLRLINDFMAIGYSIEALKDSDLTVLHHADPIERAPRMVLGAGTGLGTAQLLWCGHGYEVFASQGGHADFAPGDEQQLALLQYLLQHREHVAYEDVLSGPGLVRIYQFMRQAHPYDEPAELTRQMQNGDAAAAVAQFALEHGDENARRALTMFADIYAAQAGNLALINLAYGGVYLAGGIAPKVLPVLDTQRVRDAFTRKGKMSALMQDIPLYVIRNTKAGVLGAAQAAQRL